MVFNICKPTPGNNVSAPSCSYLFFAISKILTIRLTDKWKSGQVAHGMQLCPTRLTCNLEELNDEQNLIILSENIIIKLLYLP